MRLLQTNVLLFLFLSCVQVQGQNILDPFIEKVIHEDLSPIIPRRGYPEPLPFTETNNVLVSMHIPTIENPPSPVSEMPKVTEVDTDWEHTKEGDVIYNITEWFPLEKMRSKNAEEEERWVYYNQTSGYIIANADRFLQSSIYDYVKGNILKHGITFRISMNYIEIADSIPLEVQGIEESEYKTLIKYSGNVGQGEKVEFRNGDGELEIVSYMERYDVNYVDLSVWLTNQSHIRISFFLKTNQWKIHECGISSSGKRRVMMVKCECQNRLGQLVYFPMEKEKFVKMPVYSDEHDPFSDVDNRLIYHAGYKVPPDVIQLLYPSNGGTDPFSGEVFDLPEKYKGDRVDVSELLLNWDIQSMTIFDRPSSMLVAYATERNHEMIEELLSGLGPHSLLSFLVNLNFYEIDSEGLSENYQWRVEDLLAGNPVKLASIGCISSSGFRTDLSLKESYFKVDLMRNGYDTAVDLDLDMKLGLPALKLGMKQQVEVKYDVPMIMKVTDGKNGRVVVMMIGVTKILDTADD